jgi:hypothetical protein
MDTAYIRKDFKNNIIDHETYVDFETLNQLLDERGYSSGDILADYTDVELEV